MYLVPEYTIDIIERLKDRNWITHNFQLSENDDLYNIENYLENHQSGIHYTLYLDVNLYQFVINAVKKPFPKDEFRDAIALVIFCQLAKIDIEPTYAVYEKLNYKKCKTLLDEITSDIEIFRSIDNTDTDLLANYTLGNVCTLELSRLKSISHSEIQEELIRYERLKNWDTLYLIIMSITHFNFNVQGCRKEKLRAFIKWLIEDFMLSLVCITYALVYFSNKPFKKMMKFKLSDSPEVKRQKISNMTWDLYTLDRYFRLWTKRNSNEEALYASNDRAFNELLKCAITIQNTNSFKHFENILPADEIDYVEQVTNSPDEFFTRKAQSNGITYEYRAQLIEKFEGLLGVTS